MSHCIKIKIVNCKKPLEWLRSASYARKLWQILYVEEVYSLVVDSYGLMINVHNN